MQGKRYMSDGTRNAAASLILSLGLVHTPIPGMNVSRSFARPVQPAIVTLSTDAKERIARIENGLLPPVVVKGEPILPMRLRDRMQFYKTPGVSVAFINNEQIEWTRAFGVRETGTAEPVTTETLFQAGSISKAVTAIAALRLVEARKLRLDEDVNLKLRTWKVPDSEFTKEKKVTLRGLLSHSAGVNVPSFVPGYLKSEPAPTLLQILDGAKPAI
ncbi:MAG TPA: serine hydrolase domain-containing protein, partial [Pyrinomonadaceae bacterium]|nr:serine hydrolase domain-containing protein [Pyrinomonadaceae bacterium]